LFFRKKKQIHLTAVIINSDLINSDLDVNSDFEKRDDRAIKRLHNGAATPPISNSVMRWKDR
jgi:hypothetical protein